MRNEITDLLLIFQIFIIGIKIEKKTHKRDTLRFRLITRYTFWMCIIMRFLSVNKKCLIKQKLFHPNFLELFKSYYTELIDAIFTRLNSHCMIHSREKYCFWSQITLTTKKKKSGKIQIIYEIPDFQNPNPINPDNSDYPSFDVPIFKWLTRLQRSSGFAKTIDVSKEAEHSRWLLKKNFCHKKYTWFCKKNCMDKLIY